MPRAPRDKDSAAPKKPARKTKAKSENGVHAENGNGAVTQSAVEVSEVAAEVQVPHNMEERIRERAYELYLQRGGHGGSPEQDWLRAKQEICGNSVPFDRA
jgi:hypothetical protein